MDLHIVNFRLSLEISRLENLCPLRVIALKNRHDRRFASGASPRRMLARCRSAFRVTLNSGLCLDLCPLTSIESERINRLVLHADRSDPPSPERLYSLRTWRAGIARAANANALSSVSALILLRSICCLTIFNLEIGSADAVDLIPTLCPSVIPLTLSALGQIRLRSHGQFLYANLLITQRKHIGRIRCFPAACIPVFCPLFPSSPPLRFPVPVFLSSFSSHSANRFQARSPAPLRRWKSQKIPRPRQNYGEMCREKRNTPSITPAVHIFTRLTTATGFPFFFQSRDVSLSLVFFRVRIN